MLLSFTAERGDAMSAKVYGGGAMSAKGEFPFILVIDFEI